MVQHRPDLPNPIHKSKASSMYSESGITSRFYCLPDSDDHNFLFVVTVEKSAKINITFFFEELEEAKSKMSQREYFSRDGDKIDKYRIRFGDNGIASTSDLSRRTLYIEDYNRATQVLCNHIESEENWESIVASSMI